MNPTTKDEIPYHEYNNYSKIEYLTLEQIIERYKHFLTEKEIELIKNKQYGKQNN